MTIFERIKSSTIEEATDFVEKYLIGIEVLDYIFCKSDCTDEGGCPHPRKCIENWLNSPCEDCPLFD